MDCCGFALGGVSLLRCPRDRGELRVSVERVANEQVLFDADVTCEDCGTVFPIREGILVLLTQQEQLVPEQQAEALARDSGADVYDQRLASRDAREIPSTLAALPPLAGAKVIEYGCGTGRLTGGLLSAELVVASDFSGASLKTLTRKYPHARNLAAVLADSTSLHTAPAAFDYAAAMGLLHHLPPPLRDRLYAAAYETLRPGGTFVFTVYHHDLRSRLKRRPREGHHGSGILYHRFSRAEIRSEAQQLFEVQWARPIDIVIPGEGRIGLLPRLGGAISQGCERVPLLRQFGESILVRAHKPDSDDLPVDRNAARRPKASGVRRLRRRFGFARKALGTAIEP